MGYGLWVMGYDWRLAVGSWQLTPGRQAGWRLAVLTPILALVLVRFQHLQFRTPVQSFSCFRCIGADGLCFAVSLK